MCIAADGYDALIHLGGILRDGMNGIFYRPEFNFRTTFVISQNGEVRGIV